MTETTEIVIGADLSTSITKAIPVTKSTSCKISSKVVFQVQKGNVK